MDYRAFLERGREEWEAAETLLTRARRAGLAGLHHAELEQLAAVHRRVVSDFAFARTHYPGTAAEARLRALAFAGHRTLGRREEPVLPRLRCFFFGGGYAQAFRAASAELGIASAIFLGAVLLGATITAVRPEFAAMFLGQETLESLRDGEFWVDKVFRMAPPALLSSAIFSNNIGVALLAWAGGALAGLPTVYLLAQNGMMLGSIFVATAQSGMAPRLTTFIAAHGPLELSLIIVASAAGLVLARGAIEPALPSRAAGFAAAGRRSVRLMLGTVPWFVVLGLVEAFVSPAVETPAVLKTALGWSLLGLFLVWALERRTV